MPQTRSIPTVETRETIRQLGKQAIHDHVIRSLVPLWRSGRGCEIDSNPGTEMNHWVGAPGIVPDLIGWVPEPGGKRVLWTAEVETEDTVTLRKADQWRQYAELGLPLHLVVPVGFRDLAMLIARSTGIPLAGVYGYAFLDGQLTLFSAADTVSKNAS